MQTPENKNQNDLIKNNLSSRLDDFSNQNPDALFDLRKKAILDSKSSERDILRNEILVDIEINLDGNEDLILAAGEEITTARINATQSDDLPLAA